MPELPEVQALADVLDTRLAGLTLADLQVVAISALKTAEPPYTRLLGQRFTRATRTGKYLVLHFEDAVLAIHLARAGWLQVKEPAARLPVRPGKGPLVLRAVFVTPEGEPQTSLDVTEAGTRKSASLHIAEGAHQIDVLTTLGPDALALAPQDLAVVLTGAGSGRLKTVLRDQRTMSGIGNAYSDEILHRARLSPYQAANRLNEEQVGRLHTAMQEVLTEATQRARAADPTTMKAEKRTGLAVHNRAGEKCPVCGTVIAEVRLADSSFQYCPGCQTGGKVLADRGLSRLLK